MQLDLTNHPSDPELLQRLVRDIAAAIDHRDIEIERLKSIIKQLQRMRFDRSSERTDPRPACTRSGGSRQRHWPRRGSTTAGHTGTRRGRRG